MTTYEQESLGIHGFLLIFCVIELFIAIYFPIFSIGIKGVSELNLVIFILFLLTISRVLIRREKACIHGFDYVIFLYIFYSLLSYIYSCYSNEYSYLDEFIAFKNLMNHFIIYFLLKNAIENIKQAQALITSLIIIFVFASVFSLLAYFFWPHGSDFISKGIRARSIFGDSNLFGMFIVTLSPFLFLSFQPKQGINKLIKIGAIFVVMLALLKTGSRGSFVAQCMVLTLFLFETKQKSKAVVSGMMAVVVICIFSYFPSLGGKTVFTRFQNTEERDLSNYSSGRWTAWQESLRDYLRKPILGYGFNSFSRAYGIKHWGRPLASHNEYINILFTLGAIGFSLFALMYYKVWMFLKKNDDLIIAKACRYGMTGYFVAITFCNPSDVRYFSWLLLAISLRFIDLSKNKDSAIMKRTNLR